MSCSRASLPFFLILIKNLSKRSYFQASYRLQLLVLAHLKCYYLSIFHEVAVLKLFLTTFCRCYWCACLVLLFFGFSFWLTENCALTNFTALGLCIWARCIPLLLVSIGAIFEYLSVICAVLQVWIAVINYVPAKKLFVF